MSSFVPRTDVVVIGAGIAGLTVAFTLNRERPDLNVVVLEASERPGGKVLSEKIETRYGAFLVEAGPDAVLTSKPWALDLTSSLGLGDALIPIDPRAPSACVLRAGESRPLERGVSLLAPLTRDHIERTSLLSPPGKARALAGALCPLDFRQGDESIAAFVRRWLGDEAVDWLAEPILAGIYNADPERLSMHATFPQLPRLATLPLRRESTNAEASAPEPAFVALRGGTETLIVALMDRIGSCVQLRAPVDRLRRRWDGRFDVVSKGSNWTAPIVVLAVAAREAARLLGEVAPVVSTAVGQLRAVDAGSVTLAYAPGTMRWRQPGYGLVIPARERRPINAITLASSKFEGRAPTGSSLVRVFFGGYRSPATSELPDEHLVRVVHDEVTNLVGATSPPIFSRVHRWPAGSPQYDVDHQDRIAAIDAALPVGVLVTGSPYRGVGLPDIVRDAVSVAGRAAAAISVLATRSAAGEAVSYTTEMAPHD